jgi:hypothetical protein
VFTDAVAVSIKGVEGAGSVDEVSSLVRVAVAVVVATRGGLRKRVRGITDERPKVTGMGHVGGNEVRIAVGRGAGGDGDADGIVRAAAAAAVGVISVAVAATAAVSVVSVAVAAAAAVGVVGVAVAAVATAVVVKQVKRGVSEDGSSVAKVEGEYQMMRKSTLCHVNTF